MMTEYIYSQAVQNSKPIPFNGMIPSPRCPSLTESQVEVVITDEAATLE
jgi:hypothetical protein